MNEELREQIINTITGYQCGIRLPSLDGCGICQHLLESGRCRGADELSDLIIALLPTYKKEEKK
jgi:hypothetical protein